MRARGQERLGDGCWPCSHSMVVVHESGSSVGLLLSQHNREPVVYEPLAYWHSSGLLGRAGARDLPSSTGDNVQWEANISSAESGVQRPGCLWSLSLG